MTKINPNSWNGVNKNQPKETFIGKTIRSILLNLPKMKEQPTEDSFVPSTKSEPDKSTILQQKTTGQSEEISSITELPKKKEPQQTSNWILREALIPTAEAETISSEFDFDETLDEDSKGFLSDYPEEMSFTDPYEEYWKQEEERRRQEEALLLAGLGDTTLSFDADFYSELFPNFVNDEAEDIFEDEESETLPSFFDIGDDIFSF